MPEVYSQRKSAKMKHPIPQDAVYVGRPSPWGNPYAMESEAQRDWACDQFEEYAISRLESDPHWLDQLRGKSLVCWCHPKRCHADTLLRLANEVR